jgi:hypothetical protein
MSTRRRTPAEISKIITQYHASGQSRHVFAKRHGIAPATLARWLQRRPADSAGANFVHVIAPPPSPAWFVLALPDGRRLRIPVGCDPDALRSLLDVLSGC